jgi:WD40-like Beta Propeller Repeat
VTFSTSQPLSGRTPCAETTDLQGAWVKRIFRYVIAAAVATAAVPFVADAASGDESVGVTAVFAMPVVHGVGLRWGFAGADDYRVERRLSGGDWQDASGFLGGTTNIWIDRTLGAGATAEYRVIAKTTDGETGPSPVVSATRPAEDPVVGGTDLLALDADPGASDTTLTDEVAGPVKTTGRTQMSAGELVLNIPDHLPAAGELTDRRLGISQHGGCPLTGTLHVSELAYTDDLQAIATMTAGFDGRCESDAGADGPQFFVQIRVSSSHPVVAVAASPARIDAGRVRAGTTSASHTVAVENTGTTKVELGPATISGAAAADWKIVKNQCQNSLPAHGSCPIEVAVTPSDSGARPALLTIGDSTARGHRSVRLTVTGLTVASAPTNVRAVGTFTGVDLSWDLPSSDGSSDITGFVVHRYAGAEHTTYPVEPAVSGRSGWSDPDQPAGATYAVSAVNEIGEGPQSTPGPVQPSRDVITMLDSDNGISQWAVPDGTRPVPVRINGIPASTVTGITASPDGRRLAFTQDTTLWTTSASGSDPVDVATGSAPIEPAWSPDGTRIAFTDREGDQNCVYIVPATGGHVVKVRCDVKQASWLPDARVLVVAGPSGLERIEAVESGRLLGTYEGTAGAAYPQVSPNGRWIVYHHCCYLGPYVATVPVAGGLSQLGPIVDAPTSFSWNPSGTRFIWATVSRRVASAAVSTDGSMRVDDSPVPDGPDSLYAAIWQGLGMTIKPTPALTGPSVSIAFDTSALVTGTKVTCQVDEGTPGACASPYTKSGLTTGGHMLRITAVEPGGRTVVAARSFTVDATPPTVLTTSPTPVATTGSTVTLGYSGKDANGVASYDVRYRRAAFNTGFGAFSQPWTATKATSVTMGMAAGYDYCLSARARDTFGNLSAWSAERCFTRPVDDRSMTTASSGWVRTVWSPFYLGTATQTNAYGASLTRTVYGRSFYVVATRCPTCGIASVYLGSRYIGAVNLYATTTQRQAVIALPRQSTPFGGTLKLTTRSTGKLVQIDGLAVRHF